MKCWKCGVEKLSNEFPPWTLLETCKHAALHCLRQAGSFVSQYELNYVPKTEPETSGERAYISVAMLNGDSTSVELNSAMTVFKLREIVKKKLGVPLENQQLIYNGKEMKEHTDAKASATLGHYEVLPKTTIHVRRLLYSAPKDLDKVVFDLYWGYPSSGRDYLDASVLIFEGIKLRGVLDYSNMSFPPAMRHSGDLMNNNTRTGHHLINIDLHKIPSSITHLFFTLSAWCSPTVSMYPNPSLRFYKESDPGKMLCEDTIKKLNYSQAIVMAWMSRQGGNWCVFSAGKASAGNAMDYRCLVATIQGIIANGM